MHRLPSRMRPSRSITRSWRVLGGIPVIRTSSLQSGKQAEAVEVFGAPTCLDFDHAPQCADAERVRSMMERDRNAASVRMTITPVASLLTGKSKAVTLKRGNQLASSD